MRLKGVTVCDWCLNPATGLDEDGDPECTRCVESRTRGPIDHVGRLRALASRLRLRDVDATAADLGVTPETLQLRAEWHGIERAMRSKTSAKTGYGVRKYYEHAGQSKTLTDWSTETHIPRITLMHRLRMGLSLEQAINYKRWEAA